MAAELLTDVTPQGLDRLAAGIEIPSNLPWSARATGFIDVVAVGPDHGPQAPCTHQTGYQVVFGLDGGRRDLPVGPVFPNRALASRLLHRLNGPMAAAPAPGAALDDAGGPQTSPTDPAPARPTAPAVQLELFATPATKMDPAAVVTPARSGTDEDHDRTHPT